MTVDWDFEKFLDLENQIKILMDLEKGAEADQKEVEDRKSQHEAALRSMGG